MKHSEKKQAEKHLKEKVADVERSERRLYPKEKPDLGFGRRGIAVSVTSVCCVLIMCGSMMLVSHLRKSEYYNEQPVNSVSEPVPAVQTVTASSVETGIIYNNRPAQTIKNSGETDVILGTSPAVTEKNPDVTSASPEEAPEKPEEAPEKTTAQSSRTGKPQSEQSDPFEGLIITDVPTVPERDYTGELLFG